MSNQHDDDRVPGQTLGLPDPDHDPAYAHVRAALTGTGADHAPKPGWEDAVWARIDGAAGGLAPAPPAARGRRTMRRLAACGLAVAMAAAAVLVWRPWRPGPDQDGRHARARGSAAAGSDLVAARLTRVPGAARVRADGWSVGDTVRVEHLAAGAAVWIYRGEDRLVVACEPAASAGPACHPAGEGVIASATLDVPGTYHVIAAVGAGVAPASYDLALAALGRAQIRPALKQSIEVH